MQINFHYVFLVLRNLTFIKLIAKSLGRIFRYSAKFYSMEINLKAYFPLDEKFARREIFIPIGMRNKIIMQ